MTPATDLLDRLRQQQAPASHLARVRDLVDLAARDSRLQAIALVGSYAKGVGDRLSDLDLAAFVSPGAAGDVLQAAQALLGRAEVLNRFGGHYGSSGCFCKWVYLDFSSVEFHVFEPESPFRLRRPWLPLWDPQQLLQHLEVEGEPIRHEDFAAYEYGDDGLIWELVDCIKWLSRGRNALARQHLIKLAAAMSRPDQPAAPVPAPIPDDPTPTKPQVR